MSKRNKSKDEGKCGGQRVASPGKAGAGKPADTWKEVGTLMTFVRTALANASVIIRASEKDQKWRSWVLGMPELTVLVDNVALIEETQNSSDFWRDVTWSRSQAEVKRRYTVEQAMEAHDTEGVNLKGKARELADATATLSRMHLSRSRSSAKK